jgi:hypothetical protein
VLTPTHAVTRLPERSARHLPPIHFSTSRVFTKLDITSRAQLSRALTGA